MTSWTSLTKCSCNSWGPQTSRISCGSIGPSVSCWPFLTRSPLKTMTCLPIGIRCSSCNFVTGSVIKMQRLPRTLGPKSAIPSILEISEAFLRTTRLKQFRHARQTARNIAGFCLFARCFGDQRSRNNRSPSLTTIGAPEGWDSWRRLHPLSSLMMIWGCKSLCGQ